MGIAQEEIDINLIRPLCTINARNLTTNIVELKKKNIQVSGYVLLVRKTFIMKIPYYMIVV